MRQEVHEQVSRPRQRRETHPRHMSAVMAPMSGKAQVYSVVPPVMAVRRAVARRRRQVPRQVCATQAASRAVPARRAARAAETQVPICGQAWSSVPGVQVCTVLQARECAQGSARQRGVRTRGRARYSRQAGNSRHAVQQAGPAGTPRQQARHRAAVCRMQR